jgi:hypothetical protein
MANCRRGEKVNRMIQNNNSRIHIHRFDDVYTIYKINFGYVLMKQYLTLLNLNLHDSSSRVKKHLTLFDYFLIHVPYKITDYRITVFRSKIKI